MKKVINYKNFIILATSLLVMIPLVIYFNNKNQNQDKSQIQTYKKALYFKDSKILDLALTLDYSLDSRRLYFDGEIKKLNGASVDIKFVEDKLRYLLSDAEDKVKSESFSKRGIEIKKTLDYESKPKKGWYENAEITYTLGDYKLVVASPWDKEYQSFFSDIDDLQYTKLTILKGDKIISSKEIPALYPNKIQEFYLDNTQYINIFLNAGGMHGCCSTISVVYDKSKNEAPKIGDKALYSDEAYEPEINSRVFSKNNELYIVLVGNVFSYPASRGATVPMIYRIDKNTGNLILASKEFSSLYMESANLIMKQLEDMRSKYDKEEFKVALNYPPNTEEIEPFFYYYNEMILLGKTNINEYDQAIKDFVLIYKKFFGEDKVLDQEYLYKYKNWSAQLLKR